MSIFQPYNNCNIVKESWKSYNTTGTSSNIEIRSQLRDEELGFFNLTIQLSRPHTMTIPIPETNEEMQSGLERERKKMTKQDMFCC